MNQAKKDSNKGKFGKKDKREKNWRLVVEKKLKSWNNAKHLEKDVHEAALKHKYPDATHIMPLTKPSQKNKPMLFLN